MTFRAVLASLALVLSLPLAAGAATPPSDADVLFHAGRFNEAATAYRARLAAHPNDAEAVRRLGAIRLYANDLTAASGYLDAAERVDPGNASVSALREELKRRRAEMAKPVRVPGGLVSVPFLSMQPLPTIRVRLNGTRDATFLIDTGAPDIVVGTALAKDLGVTVHDAGVGTFAGGKGAAVGRTTIQSIALANAVAEQVSAAVLPLPQLGEGPHADGIIGTGLLERFLATIDYPAQRLVLRPRGEESSTAFQGAARSAGATTVPCWLVGDHFVFADAQVNDAPAGLFLFDSGLAGGGLSGSQSLLDAAHITLDRAHAFTGVGGGGPVQAIPFTAARVSVGDAVQHDVRGIYSPGRSPLSLFPFTAQGVISHDFLKHYAYTVDFDAMHIVLTPPLSRA